MIAKSSIAALVAPFAVFMLFLGMVDGGHPDAHYLLYPVKSLLVAAVIAWFWRDLPPMKPVAVGASIGIGVLGVILWVGMEPLSNGLSRELSEVWNQAAGAVGMT
ncbi:MAG TPA: hypothetical protein VIN06_14085, partial [Devosia sp.]